MTELTSWMDIETLCLLFGMMVVVSVLSETGLFDWFAVKAYKVRQALCHKITLSCCDIRHVVR
jgi:Na+/H+ antiporter NhaD/arsenite permease-like protein